jgi:Ca2+-binding EF-hand superfamily protein
LNELVSGLSVLCGGTRDDKCKIAFQIYDSNGDGFISLDEMVSYLTSVFRVVYASEDGLTQKIGASVEMLASITACDCFKVCLMFKKLGKVFYIILPLFI